MTWSHWLVPSFITSIFFFLGVITLYWSVFTWTTEKISAQRSNFSVRKIQCIIGLTCTIISVFGIQLLVRDSTLSWTFTSFQLLILIFVAYFLQIWIPYWAIILTGIVFMVMNGNIDQPLSWLYTAILGGFYAVSYLQSVRMWPHPLLRYLVTALLFGAVLWAPVCLRFKLPWATYGEQLFTYLCLAGLMYGYFKIQDRDRRIKHRLFQAANWDALTKVKNYAAYDHELGYEYHRSITHHHDLAMIMFDIDHFKRVNDTYGHLAGDEVLKQLASTVTTVLQRYEGTTLFRTGGEEFNIVAPDTTLVSARQIASEVFDAVQDLEIPYNAVTLHVTISLGVSELAVDDSSPLEFYKRVDGNLYHSKKNGRMQITAS